MSLHLGVLSLCLRSTFALPSLLGAESDWVNAEVTHK